MVYNIEYTNNQKCIMGVAVFVLKFLKPWKETWGKNRDQKRQTCMFKYLKYRGVG